MVKALISTCMLMALVGGAVAPASAATTFDKRTYFTFSQPVGLPGVTLPAGTYTFHLVSPFSDPKVVQVTDRAGMHSYGMLMAISATRFEASTKPEIEFMETGIGAPNAVRGWWYAGETTGYQFIYSKEQLRRLSAGVAPAPSAVSTASAPIAESSDRAEEGVAASAPAVKVEAPAEAAASAPAETADDQASTPAPPAQAPAPAATAPAQQPAQQDARTELPHTASPIWLLLFLGTLTASIGVLLVRGVRRA
jgi:hypothetical protein